MYSCPLKMYSFQLKMYSFQLKMYSFEIKILYITVQTKMPYFALLEMVLMMLKREFIYILEKGLFPLPRYIDIVKAKMYSTTTVQL